MRVILADDAAVIREGLARLLAEEGVEIAAQVGDAGALIAAVERDPPDAVVVDIRMPPTFSSEGLEAAQAIRDAHPAVAVLVLSQHIDAAYAMKLVDERAERVGYLLKDRIADVAALVEALRRVCAGETVVDPGLVGELLDAPRHEDPLAELTPREREVLALVAEGRTDRGIAEALWLSPKTVETHVRTIFRKLDLPSAPSENRRVHAVLAFLDRDG
ncbi:MAG TPA: response regulator transcription factor [Solirubrobacteraceae bacterium]